MLDLFATFHDARLWKRPDEFDSDRFAQAPGDPFAFIPRGRGNYWHDHRCAGERLMIEQLKLALLALTRWMAYEVFPQKLSIDLSKIPTLPRSRFVISGIKRKLDRAGTMT